MMVYSLSRDILESLGLGLGLQPPCRMARSRNSHPVLPAKRDPQFAQ